MTPLNAKRAALRSIAKVSVTTASPKTPTKPIAQTTSDCWRKFFQR